MKKIIIILLMAGIVNAYVISHNRVISSPAKVININETIDKFLKNQSEEKTMKKTVTLTDSLVSKIMNCRPKDGTFGYQSGYSDACDWIREVLNIKTSRFKSAPTSERMAPTNSDSVTRICFKMQTTGYVSLNASEYRIQYWHDWANKWPTKQDYYSRTESTDDEWRIYPSHKVTPKDPYGSDLGYTYEMIANGTE